MKKLGYISILIVVIMLLTSCKQGTDSNTSKLMTNPYKRTEFMMGTVVTVKIYDEGKEEVLTQVFDRIQTLANKITVNESGSEVDLINENAGKKPVKVSKDIYKLIDTGKNYSNLVNGKFDISIGPLTSLWHIGFPDARKPAQSEIEQAVKLINYNDVELNKQNQTVFLRNKGMELDLGAIAKGFITDEVVAILHKHNVTSAIIDLGGNIYVLGKNPNQNDWTVGIQDPFSARGETIGKLPESNQSIVTSGIYERYLEVDNKTYHHILNPQDGYPYNNDLAGVTIISDHSIDGDALSTSIFALGIEDGLKFVEEKEGTEAIFISTDKKVYVSSGVKDKFELTNNQFELMN